VAVFFAIAENNKGVVSQLLIVARHKRRDRSARDIVFGEKPWLPAAQLDDRPGRRTHGGEVARRRRLRAALSRLVEPVTQRRLYLSLSLSPWEGGA